MGYDLDEECQAKAAVDELVARYNAGELTGDGLIEQLVALPPVKQAPLPDTEWYDAIVRNHGPVRAARLAAYDGRLPTDVYIIAVRRMLAAHHEA